MNRVSKQLGIFDISQPYRPPRPITRIALLFLCVLYLIVVPLPLGKIPFAVQLNNNNNNKMGLLHVIPTWNFLQSDCKISLFTASHSCCAIVCVYIYIYIYINVLEHTDNAMVAVHNEDMTTVAVMWLDVLCMGKKLHSQMIQISNIYYQVN
jgi:hypothetical protein